MRYAASPTHLLLLLFLSSKSKICVLSNLQEMPVLLQLYMCPSFGSIFFMIKDGCEAQKAGWVSFAIAGIMLVASYIQFVSYLYTLRGVRATTVVPARAWDALGPFIGLLVSLVFHLRVPIGLSLYFSLLCANLSAFFIVVMFRPVTTDFGVLIMLAGLTVCVSLRDYGYGWQTRLALIVCCFLVLLRYIMYTSETPKAASNHTSIDIGAAVRHTLIDIEDADGYSSTDIEDADGYTSTDIEDADSHTRIISLTKTD